MAQMDEVTDLCRVIGPILMIGGFVLSILWHIL